MARNKLINIHSSVTGKLPNIDATNTDTLQYGEIAINYAKGSETITIRNTEDNLAKFLNSDAFRYGTTTVTNLENVPIKTRLVYAELTSEYEALGIDTSGLVDVFSEFPNGIQLKIIINNATTEDSKYYGPVYVELPWDVGGNICNVKTLEIYPDEDQYGIITVDIKSTTEMCFYAETITKTIKESTGYTLNYTQVAFSDGTNFKYVYDCGSRISDFKRENPDYDPIGIVVIPASLSTSVYPTTDVRNGKNIIMSLTSMDNASPDTGSSANTELYWGYPNSSTKYYSIIPTFSDGEQSLIMPSSMGCIPILDTTSVEMVCKNNTRLKYSTAISLGVKPCSTPLKLVGKELTIDTTYTNSDYATSDVSGPYWTSIMTALATSQSDWKTATTITDNNTSGYYPALCCCARFSTKGTASLVSYKTENPSYDFSKGVTGVWYMPACGEGGYAVPLMNVRYSSTLTKLKEIYGVAVAETKNASFHTTTLSSATDSVGYYLVGNGAIVKGSSSTKWASRAFCALP